VQLQDTQQEYARNEKQKNATSDLLDDKEGRAKIVKASAH
jgi:hypothetical protein